MDPERLPLSKLFDVPFLSLDGTSVEMASLLFLFLLVLVISRVQRHRQIVRRVVQVLSIGFFFYIVYSCLGVFGMIRNSLFGLTLIGSAYTESFYWMALPVVVLSATLIAGPVFCGWICPTGTLQDLADWLRTRMAKRRRGRLSPAQLVVLAVLVSGFLAALIVLSIKKELFVEDSSLHWAASLILLCYLVLARIIDDIPTRKLRILSFSAIFVTAASHLVITSPMHFAFTARSDPASALATVIIMIAALFVARSWCRYLCPWGYLTGLLHRFSRLRIVSDRAVCNDCGVCKAHCAVDAIDNGRIRTEACQFCFSCVDHCPTGAFQLVDVWRLSAERPAAPATTTTIAEAH
ncbi:MAG: 4Fe-4S binding protein [Polyangiaceae bacterium]